MQSLHRWTGWVLLFLAGCGGSQQVIAPQVARQAAAPMTMAAAPSGTQALTAAGPAKGPENPPPLAVPNPQSLRSAARPGAIAPTKPATSTNAAAIPLPAPASVAKPQEPTLDIASLQKRLRETDAIGMFTKLALKNQVDALMAQFRAHYQGTQKTSLTELRQPYDLLVLKVLALLQDEDPPLAKTILGSREAMWNILADREKFNAAI